MCVRVFETPLQKPNSITLHCIFILHTCEKIVRRVKKTLKNNKSSFELELHLMFDKMYEKGQGFKWTRQVWMLNIGHLDPPAYYLFYFWIIILLYMIICVLLFLYVQTLSIWSSVSGLFSCILVQRISEWANSMVGDTFSMCQIR